MEAPFVCVQPVPLRRRRWHPTPVLLPGKSHGWRAWWAAGNGVAKSRTQLSDFTFTFHFHALEKEMATHSSVLAWRIPGPSMGLHRVRHEWSDLAAAAMPLNLSLFKMNLSALQPPHQSPPRSFSSHLLSYKLLCKRFMFCSGTVIKPSGSVYRFSINNRNQSTELTLLWQHNYCLLHSRKLLRWLFYLMVQGHSPGFLQDRPSIKVE